MKKGFTLVEMLGVLVILSILLLITYTGMTVMDRKTKEREYEDYKKTLYMFTESCIKTNNIEIEDEFYISVNELIEKAALDKVVENPKTKQAEYEARIKVTKDQAGVLMFEYIGE